MRFETVKDLYDYLVDYTNDTNDNYSKKRQKVALVSFTLLEDKDKQAILDAANDGLAEKIADSFATAVSNHISELNIKPLNLQL